MDISGFFLFSKKIKVRQVKIFSCFILMFLFSFHFSISQLPQKDFYFKHIKTEHGLSDGFTNDILKDKYGFLWIATFNGLNCFDGSHFKIWKADPSNKKALQIDIIHEVCEDGYGNIWCATDAGVSKFNRSYFENYLLEYKKNNDARTAVAFEIICSEKGEIVCATDNGVFVYDSLQNKFINYGRNNLPENEQVPGIYKNGFTEDTLLNGIWIGTDRGIWFFDLETKVFQNEANNPNNFPVFNNHWITPVTFDNNHRLVYYDESLRKLMTYDFSSNTLTGQSSEPWGIGGTSLTEIFIDRNNNKWVSTWRHAPLFLESSTGRIYKFKHEADKAYSVSSNFFWKAMQDEEGTIYIASLNGVSYTNVEKNFFSIHPLPGGIKHYTEFFASLILNSDKQNNIWLAPSFEYALRYNTKTEEYKKFDFVPDNKKIPGTQFISAMAPAREKLYFGTIDGIYVYDVKSEKIEQLKDIPDSEKISGCLIKVMLLTSKNELWFVPHTNGVVKYNLNTRLYKHYIPNPDDPNSITKNLIVTLHEAHDGGVWLNAVYDGLVKYNEAGDNFEYISRNSQSTILKTDMGLLQDDGENLWLMAVAKGLVRYNIKSGEAKMVFPNSGLSNMMYRDALLVGNDLWMAFLSNYSIFNTQTLKAQNFKINYSEDNLSYMNHLFRMADGRIVSESRDAFIILDPQKRVLHTPMEPVIISGFKGGEVTYDFLQQHPEIKLSHSQNSFSFDFSTISFMKNNNITFSYMLEGLDKDWIECGTRQTAYFTNITGGSYLFRVKAHNTDGTWTESTIPVKITVAKIFYTTIWFRIILFAVLFACIIWYIRLVGRRALKKDADKAISYFANSLQGKNKEEELLWDITHNVITRTNLVDCVVYLIDENKNVLVQKAAFGDKNPEEYKILNPIEIPVGKGIVGNVAATGKAEIIPDTSADPRYIPDETIRLSEITVPIISEGKVIGVIDSEHHHKNFFTKEHLELLQTIASITATKIVKARKEMEVEDKEKRLSDLKIQMTRTRQQALQAQMNPHFIFNCLNSINGFILQNDAVTASTFLIKFSKLIRLILEHSNEKSVSLQSELDALKLYIEMESLRFGKKFSYEINVDKNIAIDSIQVPPLILQPFVENSIWHGLLHKATEGQLYVNIAQNNGMLECIIEDNGIGREISATFKSKTFTHKKSLGLKLTNERLALLNQQEGKDASVLVTDMKDNEGKPSGTKVTVSLPLIDELH